MEISGKINLFVATREKEGNKFKTFRASVSTKKEDGSYETASVDVNFDKEQFPAEKLNKLDDKFVYTLIVEEGWIGVRSYQKDDKRIPVLYFYVKKGKLDGKKELAPKNAQDSDLPF